MADFICDDLFNIQSKKLRWLLRCLFWIIGVIPYLVILFFVGILANNVLNLKDSLLFTWTWNNALTSLASIGGCALWFLFCKFVKAIIVNISANY